MDTNYQKVLNLMCFASFIIFIITLSLLTYVEPKCQQQAKNVRGNCSRVIGYSAVLFADMEKHSKPAKRFQLCNEQIGNNLKANAPPICSMGEGNKRRIEFPVRNSDRNLKEAFNGEMAYGALLADYLGIWTLSLDYCPSSKECVNVENGGCKIKCDENEINIAMITTTTQMLTKTNNDELILVQALWRHGDRSPRTTFKTDIYQEEQWPQGWGQLSPRGMAQHVQLGKQLRERYVHALKFIGKQYNRHEIYVRSTDTDRTLSSAISNLIGFYGPGSGKDYPQELDVDWPGGYVPIPIHTHSGKEEHAKCPRQVALRKLMKKTPEYKKAQEHYKGLLDFLRQKTGEEMADTFDCWLIGEAFMIEKLNNRTLVDWAEGNETLYKEVKKCEHLGKRWGHGHGLSQVDGLDFRMELGRMRGGPILWKFIANIQNKLRCERCRKMPLCGDLDKLAARKSPVGTLLCKWMKRLRYYAFSAHDTTIASLFSALGLDVTNYDEDGAPYSACVTIELWRRNVDDGMEHYLKVLYWRPGPDGAIKNVEITKDIEGCPQTNGRGCTLEQFIARSRPYQMLPSAKEYCHKPLLLNKTARSQRRFDRQFLKEREKNRSLDFV